jgi:hypothetical protein
MGIATHGIVLWALLIVASAAMPNIVSAQDVSHTCTEFGSPRQDKLKIGCTGAASGKVTVNAAFGKLSLPATREEREQGGKSVRATLIRADGTADVLMPECKGVDACLAGKVQPGENADVAALYLMSCLASTANGATPSAVQASVSIALVPIDGDTYREVFVSRTDPATAGSEPMKIETLLTCLPEQ